jgi:two-component system phosphate regulon sensor histidine kinase PhoR
MLIIIFSFYYTVMTVFRQKKLSDMKTDFINNMTHEFKTPVATILLASEALKDPAVTDDKDRLKRLAGVIYDENKRIGSQVERVLQLAAMEKGEFRLNLTNFDFHEMVNKVADNIAIQVENKNGQIVRSLNARKTLINADELHLSNVLYNLLDNANKYCPGTPEIKIITEDEAGGLLLAVEDNGIGMTREQQARVFEKFYRVPTGNVHNVKGFGLGLNYVKTIVDMHGGAIKLKSEKNKGSRFEVFLPVILVPG